MMTQVCFRFNVQIIAIIKSFKVDEEYRFDGLRKQWMIKNELLDSLVEKLTAINVNCILDPWKEEYQFKQLESVQPQRETSNVDIKLRRYEGGLLLLEPMKYVTYKIFSSQFISFKGITVDNKELHFINGQCVEKFFEICKNNNLTYEMSNL